MNQKVPPRGRTIVFVAPRFHTNQVGMVKALLAQDHRVIFHSLLQGETEDHSAVRPMLIPEARFSKLMRYLFGDGGINRPRAFPNPLSYYRRLASLQADLIIARDPSRAFSLVAASCARLLGVRIVFYSQDCLRRRYSPGRRTATRLLLKLFSASWYTPLLGAGGDDPPDGRYFLPFVVEGDEKRSQEKGRTTVLMVGKYNQRKNHLLLVEALASIMAESNVYAIVVGECASPAQADLRNIVARRVRELGLDSRVALIDNVPYARMPEFYRSSDLFVLPASDEPAAISVLEAIAFGVPAICSDSCGTRFYIEEGVNGAVFRSGSREDLERTLRIWLNPYRLGRARKDCRRFAVENLSSQAFYRQFREMVGERWPAEKGRW